MSVHNIYLAWCPILTWILFTLIYICKERVIIHTILTLPPNLSSQKGLIFKQFFDTFKAENIILASENSRHLMTPPLISPRNDFWQMSAKIPYWSDLDIASDWMKQIFNQSEALPRSGWWHIIRMECLRLFLSDIMSPGNQCLLHEISAVFPGWSRTDTRFLPVWQLTPSNPAAQLQV